MKRVNRYCQYTERVPQIVRQTVCTDVLAMSECIASPLAQYVAHMRTHRDYIDAPKLESRIEKDSKASDCIAVAAMSEWIAPLPKHATHLRTQSDCIARPLTPLPPPQKHAQIQTYQHAILSQLGDASMFFRERAQGCSTRGHPIRACASRDSEPTECLDLKHVPKLVVPTACTERTHEVSNDTSNNRVLRPTSPSPCPFLACPCLWPWRCRCPRPCPCL